MFVYLDVDTHKCLFKNTGNSKKGEKNTPAKHESIRVAVRDSSRFYRAGGGRVKWVVTELSTSGGGGGGGSFFRRRPMKRRWWGAEGGRVEEADDEEEEWPRRRRRSCCAGMFGGGGRVSSLGSRLMIVAVHAW